MLKKLVATMVAGLMATSSFARDVYYPVEKGRVTASSLEYQILELALSKADGDWRLASSPVAGANEKRQRAMLAEGTDLHVAWFGTSPEFESELKAVYIPISGGLLGWRLMLINGQEQSRFSAVQNVEDLQSIVMGQGDGWGDIPILEAAGLTVKTSAYNNLFKMVVGGRIDAFPRGAAEAFAEYNSNVAMLPELAIEQDLVVRYPFAKFFFVSPSDTELHDAIEQGLKRAHEDGTYHMLFLNHPSVKEVLSEARLSERRLIEIENPGLSAATLAIPEQYWFHPGN